MIQPNSYKNNDFEIILHNKLNKKIGWITYKISPFDSQKGIICHAFVKKEYRRKYYGRNLVTQTCQDLFSKGCNIVEVEITQENLAARSFFQKLDFKELLLEDNFNISNIFETAFIFCKKLT